MSTPDWLVDGADVVVIESEQYGPGMLSAQCGTVEKVGKRHFTVTDVRPGRGLRPDLPLTKFRVELDSLGRFREAGDGRMFVVAAESDDAVKALRDHARTAAQEKVRGAYMRWDKARQAAGARYLPGSGDAVIADRGPALYALADAVTELRVIYQEQGIEAPPTEFEADWDDEPVYGEES